MLCTRFKKSLRSILTYITHFNRAQGHSVRVGTYGISSTPWPYLFPYKLLRSIYFLSGTALSILDSSLFLSLAIVLEALLCETFTVCPPLRVATTSVSFRNRSPSKSRASMNFSVSARENFVVSLRLRFTRFLPRGLPFEDFGSGSGCSGVEGYVENVVSGERTVKTIGSVMRCYQLKIPHSATDP